jgi:hypothetical protein
VGGGYIAGFIAVDCWGWGRSWWDLVGLVGVEKAGAGMVMVVMVMVLLNRDACATTSLILDFVTAVGVVLFTKVVPFSWSFPYKGSAHVRNQLTRKEET